MVGTCIVCRLCVRDISGGGTFHSLFIELAQCECGEARGFSVLRLRRGTSGTCPSQTLI